MRRTSASRHRESMSTVPVGGSVTTTFDAIWTGTDAVRLGLATNDWAMAQDGQLTYLAPGEVA